MVIFNSYVGLPEGKSPIAMLVHHVSWELSFFSPSKSHGPWLQKRPQIQATLQAPRDRGIVPTALNAESIACNGKDGDTPWGLGRGLGLSLDSFYLIFFSSFLISTPQCRNDVGGQAPN